MAYSTYEPSIAEIQLTLGLGLTVLGPYYRKFAASLNLRGDEQVLDFGSGAGTCSRHIADLLKRGGGQLACVDVSHGWLDVTRKTLRQYDNVSFHRGQISELDLPDGAFDAVVIHFVLHDIPAVERPEVVRTLAHKLTPGGRLLLREPQGDGLVIDELQRLAGRGGLDPTGFFLRKVFIGRVYDACYTRR